MSKITSITVLFISFLFLGCSSSSSISKANSKASQAMATGDFETAFLLYNTFIQEKKNANKQLSGELYSSAAKAAFQYGKINEAESFFKQAYYKEYADAEMYANMISIYRQIDNLSKEIDALEYFVQHFSSDPRFKDINIRLFETYVESENWDKAIALWSEFDSETLSDIKTMELYLRANKELGYFDVANKLAKDILKKNVTSNIALDYMAEKYFWIAENRYQKEMDAYEKKKTNKQYAIMLKALDDISMDFKKALGYYRKLYKLYPSKEYAKQMANIYARFQDKKNSDYYRKLSK